MKKTLNRMLLILSWMFISLNLCLATAPNKPPDDGGGGPPPGQSPGMHGLSATAIRQTV